MQRQATPHGSPLFWVHPVRLGFWLKLTNIVDNALTVTNSQPPAGCNHYNSTNFLSFFQGDGFVYIFPNWAGATKTSKWVEEREIARDVPSVGSEIPYTELTTDIKVQRTTTAPTPTSFLEISISSTAACLHPHWLPDRPKPPTLLKQSAPKMHEANFGPLPMFSDSLDFLPQVTKN